MDYKVVVTPDAEADLKRYVHYLRVEKKSLQAAKSVMDDYRDTRNTLANVAGGLKACESPKMVERGLRRINFRRHNYFMLYYLDGDKAIVTNIFHGLEDAENKLN